MRKRLRIRRRLKWCGLVLSLVLVFVFAASTRWYCDYRSMDSQTAKVYSIQSGIFIFITIDRASPDYFLQTVGPSFGRFEAPGQFRQNLGRIGWSNDSRNDWFFMPLWIPFLLVTVPTAFLFWHDRRRIPPGHCQKCRYDLTGNTSGVCPECGERI